MMKQMFLAGVVGLASSSAAVAGPFYLELGQDLSGDGNTRTADYNALGASNTLATSIYNVNDPSEIGPGTEVFDTNRSSQLGTYNFGGAISTPNDNQRNIGELNPQQGIAASNNFSGGPSDWEAGTNFWGMTFSYDLQGTIVSGDGTDLNNAAVNFNSGTFDYFFEFEGESLQVLSVDVTGSSGSIANLVLEGRVNFDFLNDDDFTNDEMAFVQNFFRDSASGDSFYDIAATGAEVPIHWRLDTNVDEDVALVEGTDADGNTVWARQTDLNNTARFQVPEPSAVMLLGLGLLGLAFVAHRRRKSDSGFAA